MKVTERIIGKAKLSPGEARAIRVYNGLRSAGEKTRKWWRNLSDHERYSLLRSAKQKIQKVLDGQRAEE